MNSRKMNTEKAASSLLLGGMVMVLVIGITLGLAILMGSFGLGRLAHPSTHPETAGMWFAAYLFATYIIVGLSTWQWMRVLKVKNPHANMAVMMVSLAMGFGLLAINFMRSDTIQALSAYQAAQVNVEAAAKTLGREPAIAGELHHITMNNLLNRKDYLEEIARFDVSKDVVMSAMSAVDTFNDTSEHAVFLKENGMIRDSDREYFAVLATAAQEN